MLQIENLQVAFRGHNGDTDVVRGLDLQIEAGETRCCSCCRNQLAYRHPPCNSRASR